MADCTVLIRTKDSERTLAATLESICKQRGEKLQVLVVDSGSQDNTLAIATSFGANVVLYPTGEGFNYSKALNLGFQNVKTDYVFCVSSHVELMSTEIASLLRNRLDDSSIAVAFCGHSNSPQVQDNESALWEDISLSSFNGFNGNSNCCAMYRRLDWCQLPFDESVPTAEDLVWVRKRLEFGRQSRSSRLIRPGILYRNPYYSTAKVLREFEAVHRYVLTERGRFEHGLRLLLNAIRWYARGRVGEAWKCLSVGKNLLIHAKMQ